MSDSEYNPCSICLCNIEEKSSKTTICNHTFHLNCIDGWLVNNETCPVCRTVLRYIDLEEIPYQTELVEINISSENRIYNLWWMMSSILILGLIIFLLFYYFS